MVVDIEQIKIFCQDATIEVTQHILMRCQQRNITYEEIKKVIRNGEIIEEYPDDYPFPSCLILGMTMDGRTIHIVVGMGEDRLWLVTAYEPDPEQWDNEFRTRKEG